MAEWLRSGLQSRLHRFDSGRRLLTVCRGNGDRADPPLSPFCPENRAMGGLAMTDEDELSWVRAIVILGTALAAVVIR